MSELGGVGPAVVPAPLSQAAGYGVVVGLGVAYALGSYWRKVGQSQQIDASRHDFRYTGTEENIW